MEFPREVHIHIHGELNANDSHTLALILAMVKKLVTEEKVMAQELDDLTAQVAATDGVIQSAVVLINSIPAMIAAAGTDPAKLKQLQSDLKANADNLAQAIASNPTPQQPAA